MFMLRSFILAVAALALVSCAGNGSKAAFWHDTYAEVEIGKENTPYLEGISENGKEVLNLYRFAAMEADKIYWKQVFGDKSVIDSLVDTQVRQYALINYGPWSRLDGKSFVEGLGDRPAGLCFYPEDMTEEEFLSWDNPLKNSPYTLVSRAEDGSLKTEWYHEAYADNISRMCNYLRAAADLTIVPSVREYLLSKIEAISTDDYTDSDIKWIEVDDSKMDLVLGAYENVDDHLFGIKRSYSAYVLLKNVAKSEELAKFTAMMPQLQAALPCPDSLKTFVPGPASYIEACDALYYAGAANAGVKDIAISLPFDTRTQEMEGTRSIIFTNVVDAKFDMILNPLAALILGGESSKHLDRNAFFWNVAFRELAHGLGVKTTLDGRDVWDALGNSALAIEEAKADILGNYLASMQISQYETNGDLVTADDAFATFLVSLVRSARFGASEAVGQGNLICYQYLKKAGAFTRHDDGKYYIDQAKAREAVAELSCRLLTIQAEGDAKAAADFISEYAHVDTDLEGDFMNMRVERIPTDVTFNFVW